jgi:hypothetical protein
MSRQAEDCEYFSVKQTESVDTLSLLNLSQKKVGYIPCGNALTIVGNPVKTDSKSVRETLRRHSRN